MDSVTRIQMTVYWVADIYNIAKPKLFKQVKVMKGKSNAMGWPTILQFEEQKTVGHN